MHPSNKIFQFENPIPGAAPLLKTYINYPAHEKSNLFLQNIQNVTNPPDHMLNTAMLTKKTNNMETPLLIIVNPLILPDCENSQSKRDFKLSSSFVLSTLMAALTN